MSNADKHAAVLAKMKKRRSSVLNSIRKAYPEMQDGAALTQQIDLVQQDTFRILFDTAGHKNPSERLGLDYVNWRVEDRLRAHFTKLPRYPIACKGFPASFVSRPGPTSAPFSAKFWRYQVQRVGDESSAGAASSPSQEPLPRYCGGTPQQAVGGPAESTSSPDQAGAGKRKVAAEGEEPANQPPAKRTRQAARKTPIEPGTREDAGTGTIKTKPLAPGNEGPTSKAAVRKGKRPVPSGTYLGPFTDDADIPTLTERLGTLPNEPIARNPLAWPKLIWQTLYHVTSPPQDGDFFALPLRDTWVPYVSDDVLVRVHDLVEPTIRVVVRTRAERGSKPAVKMLAVMFTEYGDPTSVRELNHLAETWGDVQEWHRLMLEGGPGNTMCDLDDFMRKRLLYKVAAKLAAKEA